MTQIAGDVGACERRMCQDHRAAHFLREPIQQRFDESDLEMHGETEDKVSLPAPKPAQGHPPGS